MATDDGQVHETIETLVGEEHELWQREAAGEATDADRARLDEIKVSLDQCWDLLRRRRALRDAGLPADGAQVQPTEVVERYLQ
ncbi:MAG TPA: DUF2630 family protein [Gaiellaceae bacterium]|jgi:hypothetical protein|nr:DUF2630 family protein [Gaiellaceae bacterium]